MFSTERNETFAKKGSTMDAKIDLTKAIARNMCRDWHISNDSALRTGEICNKLFEDAVVTRCEPREYPGKDADGKIIVCALAFDRFAPADDVFVTLAVVNALEQGYKVEFPDMSEWEYGKEISSRIDESADDPEYVHNVYGI